MNEYPKLTGRKRHRSTKTVWGDEILVLQVEYEFLHITYCGVADVEHMIAWRDAKTSDLTVEA